MEEEEQGNERGGEGREGPAPAPESSKHGERQTRGAEDVVFEMSKAWRIETPKALKGSIRESWGGCVLSSPSRVWDKNPGEKKRFCCFVSVSERLSLQRSQPTAG